MVVNAGCREKDLAHLNAHLAKAKAAGKEVAMTVHDDRSLLAVQGPKAAEVLASLGVTTSSGAPFDLSKFYFGHFARVNVAGIPCWVTRTGYTGEDGFEIITPNGVIEAAWDHLLRAGHAHCLQPAGLGARDTLRTEVCYPLYGHELDENTTPIEAGVGFFVALDKGEFNGRATLAAQKANGTTRRCVAFKMTDKSAPPRPHYPIWSTGPAAAKVGEVTSGTQSPSLNTGIGLGYVPADLAKPGTPIEIEIRGRRSPAVIVAKPIFKK